MQTRNATEILEMFHFMRSIRSTPPMTSFNMEIFKSDKLLFPLLQNIPFSPCKLGMRQKPRNVPFHAFDPYYSSNVQHGNLQIWQTSFPTLAKHTIFTMQTRNATEILEMFHFTRSIPSIPPMFNMEIFKSDKLLFPLLQNIPFSPCKLGMRQKSSKCFISCVRSVVLLQWHRSTWKSINLTNFFSHSCQTYHIHNQNWRCDRNLRVLANDCKCCFHEGEIVRFVSL